MLYKLLNAMGLRSKGFDYDYPEHSPSTRPIFCGEFLAFSEFDRYALRRLINSIDKRFKKIAEVGSWTGQGSTRVIVEELQNGRGILYCIDHWEGNPAVPRHRELVKNFDMLATFQANIASYGGGSCVKILAMSSEEAAQIMKDNYFDLVFIDGNHTYGSTMSDIQLWMPKLTDGGILCGHDCESRINGRLKRDDLWKHRDVDTIVGNDEFPRVHPGVILAVGEHFGASAHLWAEEAITLENGEVGKSTIWDISVRRS